MIAADDGRWDALVSRDSETDASFVYAVVTTGIYCRPSCTTPTPLRRNVRFFSDSAAAKAVGFIPCKRCRPTLSTKTAPQLTMVTRVCAAIHNSVRAPTLSSLAADVGVSRFHLQRTLKNVLGITPNEYAKELRWRRLGDFLSQGLPISDAIYQSGFGGVSRVYEKAHIGLGMTPAIWRAGGVGVVLWCASVQRAERGVLIAGTRAGVSIVEFGEDPIALEEMLHGKFPSASILFGNVQKQLWLSRAVVQLEYNKDVVQSLSADIREIAIAARLRRLVNNARVDGPLGSRIDRPKHIVDGPSPLCLSLNAGPAGRRRPGNFGCVESVAAPA